MKKLLLLFTLVLINISLSFSQGGTSCATAIPFCGTQCFANTTTTTAPVGPSYGCVLTQPNPEWFFIKTTAAGTMTFNINQNAASCTTGSAEDVDFVCWGPFATIVNACNSLTGSCTGDHACSGQIEDCSYSVAGVETMTIVSPGPGNYYVIMITNYSNAAGFIRFNQTGGPATDCSITCPSVLSGNGFLQTDGTNMPASVACNTANLQLIASNNAPFGNPITPAIIISFNDNANASNWIQWYENGTFILCDGPPADGCGINLTTSAANTVQFSTMSPSATNNIVLCENNTAQPNMPYTIVDAASGATINSGTWLDDGACQTISFPPGTISGVATWSVSPACPGCLVGTTDWGYTQFSPSAAGPGAWNICYSFDPPGACATYTYCQTLTVTNPYVAAWTAPAAVCANSGLLNLTSLLNVGTTAGGTWTGTGVSGTNFNPAVSGPGTFAVTYTVGALPCGATVTHNIIVNPVPVATATPASQTLCSGGTTGIALTSSVGGTTYAWTVVQTNVSGASAGSGSSIAQVLTATSTVPGTAVYTVTPTAGGCVGSPITVTITVNPRPVVTATPASQTICSGATTGIALTSNVGGTTFNWTVVQTNVSGASAGSGSSIAQTLSATTTSAGTAVYTITPTAGGCTGTPITVTITVNPTPIATATPTSQTLCSGSATGISLTSNVAGTTFAWTVVQTNVSGASASSGTSIAQTLTATSTVPGTAVYTITPTAGGCPGTPITVTITVNPKPVATATPASQTICSGGTTGISLTSNVAGTTFAWTVVQTNVSGAIAGSGASIAQTLTATTAAAGTAVYTITPTAGGCTGTPITVTITVNPTPVATATPASQTICSGTATSIALTSTVAGTTYAWTVVQTNVSGASAGSGSFIAQTLTATSIVAGTAVYTITPTAGGCPGAAITVTITVNPSPVATATPAAQTLCSGSTTGISLTSNVGGTTFAWTVVQTNVSGATAGSGTSIAQTLTATSTVAGTAVYTITPTAGGCSGTPITVTITVNPKPVATATPASQTICSGATTGISLTSNVGGTTFAWTVVQTNVSGASAGSGSSIAQVLTATSTVAGSVVYTITPTAGGCVGTPISVTITVNPTTVATATPTSQTFCSGGTTGISLSGTVVGTTYSWTVVQTNVSGASAGAGSSIAQTLTATSTVAGTAVYTITPSANGCPGAPVTVTITVNPNPVATATPSSQTFCSPGTTGITLTSTVGGTTFSWTVVQTGVTGASPGSGSSIVQVLSTTGAVAGTAVYTITPTAGACAGTPITVTITVNPKDNAAFTYGSSTYCQTGINPTPTVTGVAGGTFTSSPAGLSINAATGAINLAGSSLNTYTVTYTTSGICPNTSSVTVTITSAPSAGFTYPGSPFCQYSANPFPTFSAGASAGTFTAVPAGLVFVNVNTGQINLSTSTPGTYTVTNSIAASGGCASATASSSVTIIAAPVVTATPPTQTICSGNSTSIVLTSSIGGTTYSWTVVQTGVSGGSASSGSNISQTLTCTGVVSGTAVYTITPTSGGCVGLPITVTITVNPIPVVTATPSTQTICSGGLTACTLTSPVSGTTFAWTVTQAGVSGATAGSGSSIAQTLSATGATAGTAVYTITPTASGCSGTPVTFTVTVNPNPIATATPASQTICSGSITGISLTSSVAGTTFAWTVTQTGVSGAANGTGTSIAQTLTATGAVSGTAVYTITPTATGCPGTPITVTITVNPIPVATATPTTQTICSGSSASTTLTSTVGGTTFSWTVVQTNVSGATAGSGSSISQTLSATSSVTGTAVYTITPTAGGCSGASVTFTVTVNPIPVATATPTAQTLCSGSTTSISLTSTVGTTTFAWTVTQAGVSGASAGSGSSIAQTLTATGAAAGTAVYTITPTANGCSGTPITVTITVNPTPFATATPASQTICSGSTTGISLSSFTAGTTFSWTVVQTGVTGAAAGSGSSIAQTLTNTGSVAGTAVYTITPTAAGCPGTPITVTITVNPKPVATATPPTQTICSGSIASTTLTSTVAGSTFSWTVSQVGASGATAGSGASISQTLNATGTSPGTVTYTITPSASGCPGIPITFVVTVNPIPVATATPAAQTLCSGSTTGITLSSPVAGTTYAWTVVQTNVSGASAGSGSSIAQVLTATSTISGTAVYSVTPSANGCSGSPITITVTVNPTPVATATPSSQTICSGTAPAISLTSTVAGTTFNWTVTQTGASGASAGSGSSIGQVLTATGTVAGTVVYTVTPISSGCPGSPIIVNITVNPTPVITATPTTQTFCSGGTTSISLSSNVSGTTIDWTVVQTGVTGGTPGPGATIADLLTVTGTTAGTAVYTITSSASGCAGASVTATVTVNPIDNASFSYGSSTYCQTGTDPSATITGLPGGTFSVSPAGLVMTNTSTGLLDLSVSVTGTYTITYQTNGVCPTTSSITLTITNAPTATFTYAAPSYCSTDPNPVPTFSGGSAGTFSASPAGLVFVNVNTGEIDLAGSTAGTYTVTNTIASAGGCATATDNTTVTINQAATVSAGPDNTICEASTYSLPGTMGGSTSTITWTTSGSGTFSNPNLLTAIYTPSAADVTAGSVVLTITSDDPAGVCGIVSDNLTLTITPLDNSAFSYTGGTFCQTGTNPVPTVTGLPGGTFSSACGGLVFVSTSTGEINLLASALGTCAVYYTTNGVCPNVDTVSVTITTAPSAAFSYAGPYCQTASNPLPTFNPGSSAGAFSSSPVGLNFVSTSTGQIDLTTTTPGTYTITNFIAASGGCASATATNTVIIDIAPTANAGTDGTICAGSTYTIAGAGFGGSASSTTWSSSGTGTFDNTAILGATYTPSLADTAAGTVTLYLTTDNPVGACGAVVDSLILTINPTPATPAVSSTTITSCSGTAIGPITATSTGGVINWYSNASLTTLVFTGNPFLPGALTTSTSYWVTESFGACQSAPTQITITVNPLPVIDATGVAITQANCGDTTGAVLSIVITSGTAPLTYQWQDGAGANVGNGSLGFTNVGPGTYTLIVTDANGCIANAGPYTVSSTSGVTAAFTANPVTGETPLNVTFTNASVGAISYLWQFGTGTGGDTSTAFSPNYTYIPLGQFTACLIATTASGCADTACTTIDVFINSVFVIPNVFTPNGDNVNDIFTVQAVGLKTMDAEIYNRWGQKMYEWHTTNGGWDGRTASGVPAPDGTYFFIISATGIDKKEYMEKGSFTLTR
jgi:gliding motility-associated-like protein